MRVDRLRELGLCILEKRRHQGDILTASQCLKGPTRKLYKDTFQGHRVLEVFKARLGGILTKLVYWKVPLPMTGGFEPGDL